MKPLRVVYQEADLDQVMRHWVEDYEPSGGGEVSLGEFWVDTAKQTVIFKLYIEESDG